MHLSGQDEQQATWLDGGSASTLESITTWIQRNRVSWSRGGPVFNFAIWVGNELVGMVEANTDHQHTRGLEPGDANVSYAIYPKARGRGYATRAVELMLEFLRRQGTRRRASSTDEQGVPQDSGPVRVLESRTD